MENAEASNTFLSVERIDRVYITDNDETIKDYPSYYALFMLGPNKTYS